MSATARVAVFDDRGGRPERSGTQPAASVERLSVRLATFAALALYGVVRWATLLTPAPGWRLFGLFLLALGLAAAGPWLRTVNRSAAILAAAVGVLAAFAIAGVPLAWVVHLRIALSARAIGHGLSALPAALVPYNGINAWVRLVIVLGAGLLLIDAALVLAFAPRSLGDLRRAGAALPLIALAVVPSTLVRPQFPYFQGLILFALLAAFMWGERVSRHALRAALSLVAIVGAGAAFAAPRLDQHQPWIDYRAWANTFAPARIDVFNWSQSYGPLKWPRTGHEVLEVRAKQPDYWKAENLNVFNGFGWTGGPDAVGAALPRPDASAAALWTQRLTVTIEGMETTDVIGAGESSYPAPIPGGAEAGTSSGTWTAEQALSPGASYQITAYSPHPTPAQLAAAGNDYPDPALGDYRLIELPPTALSAGILPEVRFPPFHSGLPIQTVIGSYGLSGSAAIENSPYGGAYALARGLARKATTPFQFVTSVERYLSVSNGFRYDQNAPVRTYPLESFLFTDKIGYCQQFSGAMALLLRMGGIPARVASGFTSGTYDKSTREWVVSDQDAHAWVEAWFPHYGWVRFDPTPAAAPALGGAAPIPAVQSSSTRSAPLPRAPRRTIGGAAAQAGSSVQHGGGVAAPVLGGLASLLALAAAALLWVWLRAEPTGEELVEELERALARCGRPINDGVTLAALEHRFHS
jgi:hypothetical protein